MIIAVVGEAIEQSAVVILGSLKTLGHSPKGGCGTVRAAIMKEVERPRPPNGRSALTA